MKQQFMTFCGAIFLCACAQTELAKERSEVAAVSQAVPALEQEADTVRLQQAAQVAAPESVQSIPVATLAMADVAVAKREAFRSQLGKALYSGVQPARQQQVPSAEDYAHWVENRFQQAQLSPLSTFSLDVDTASYSNVRRFLTQGQMPPVDAVRIEELINYFDYDFAAAQADSPLAVVTELSHAPWNPAHQLVMVGVQARDLAADQRPANRLVFLIDTSGSMNNAAKLPLLKRSFQILVEQMRAEDSVAIVTYAGSAGLVLPATSGQHKEAIYAALNRLQAGGSTAGAQGIQLAYQVAEQQFQARANNRVILATDGDFNVGPNSEGELVRMIEKKRDKGVFLSILGFGTGNYQDAKMQKLAGHGNGTHHYIDTDREADRVFRDKLNGTLYTVAKDVKIQIEWNPETVSQYRLIGYESRLLQAEDFADDRKDAGDVGAGHSVTALYEIVPVQGGSNPVQLRYQPNKVTRGHDEELGLVKLRYKLPQEKTSQKMQQLISRGTPSGENIQWASAVAELGMLLRDSEHRAQASYDALIQRSEALLGDDALRREFLGLARQAKVASQTQLGQAAGTEMYSRR
ncbi:MAG: vWA domain-containing protein [Oceanococcus sp.]